MKRFLLLAILFTETLYAQFGTFLQSGSQNGFTFPQVMTIGLGHFSASNPTLARFHIRNSYLDQPTNASLNGLLFRTDGYSNVHNSWKMFTELGGSFSEIFKLEAPANTSNFLIQTTQSTGNILFYTGGSNFRAILTSTGLFGINSLTPGNRLEITSGTGDPYFNTVNGSSGLKFSNLTSAHTVLSNPSSKVLSVDANGNVVLVADQTASPGSGLQTAQNGLTVLSPNIVEFGGILGSASSAQLLNNREIPMNAKKILFSGTGNNFSDQITLGTSPIRIGKFSVVANEITNPSPQESYAASFENRYTGGSCSAGHFIAEQTKPSSTNNAITGVASNAMQNNGILMVVKGGLPNCQMTGSYFEVIDNTNTASGTIGTKAFVGGGTGDNYGVQGVANGPVGRNFGAAFQGGLGTHQPSDNYGVQASTDAMAQRNYAGYFQSPNVGNMPAHPLPGFQNRAIYAIAPSSITAGPQWVNSHAGYFDGDVQIIGNLQLNGTPFSTNPGPWLSSDRRYKTNIQQLDNVTEKILSLKAYTYLYRREEFKELNFPAGTHFGFIAQELKDVFPELIIEKTDGYLYVNYTELIPVLYQGLKEQISKTDELNKQMEALKYEIQSIKKQLEISSEKQSPGGTSGSNIESIDNVLVLNQNSPNPFAENTIISYNIPKQFKSAKLLFYDASGKLINTHLITKSGNGSLTVFGEGLSNGVYTYSLFIDDKEFLSKKMIKQ